MSTHTHSHTYRLFFCPLGFSHTHILKAKHGREELLSFLLHLKYISQILIFCRQTSWLTIPWKTWYIHSFDVPNRKFYNFSVNIEYDSFHSMLFATCILKFFLGPEITEKQTQRDIDDEGSLESRIMLSIHYYHEWLSFLYSRFLHFLCRTGVGQQLRRERLQLPSRHRTPTQTPTLDDCHKSSLLRNTMDRRSRRSRCIPL